jgi:cytochrome b pre-mRNA-processing protein 3
MRARSEGEHGRDDPKPLVKRVRVGVTPEDGFGKARTPWAGEGGSERVIFGLFGKRAHRRFPVDTLFARVAEASRRPALYIEGGIPDSFEGRFESLTLHLFLVLRRLRELPPPAAELAQEFIDAAFAYLELGFRNGGVSDIAVPKKMKKIGQMFYGRVQAYEAALAAPGLEALSEALARNACAPEAAPALAAFVRAAQEALAAADLDAVLHREELFPAFSPAEAAHGA